MEELSEDEDVDKIEEMKNEEDDDNNNNSSSNNNNNNNNNNTNNSSPSLSPNSPEMSPPEHQPDEEPEINPSITSWGKALYKYEALESDQLSFDVGDLIGIIENLGDGWSRGDIWGKEGVFPTNYVKPWDESSEEDPKSPKKIPEEEIAKRRENREKMKQEFREVKRELERVQKEISTKEKELASYVESKTKYVRDFQNSKAELSTNETILRDLLKLLDSEDSYLDTIPALTNVNNQTIDLIKNFEKEFQKEVKNSSALNSFYESAAHKMKLIPSYLDESSKLNESTSKDVEILRQHLRKLFLMTKVEIKN